MKGKSIIALFLLAWTVTGLPLNAQELPREFRAVWIATVENIDWPSENNLSTAAQQQEILAYLDFFKALNFNAVIFQVRPAADAFYHSTFEPWSEWLTGTQGKAPSPYYDPLAFIIDETHKRGMEFHAWMNPYRAIVNHDKKVISPLQEKHPTWFLTYGNTMYFNPGIPEVREYTAKIVGDLVQHYNIDAVHFDDYFYPYKIADTPFPDAEAFEEFGAAFYPNRLEDWRRANVDKIIYELRTKIKAVKPWVQFGISPFGVWRNKSKDVRGSDTKAGQTNYDDLYADIIAWLKNGWLDYVLPQDYWHIGFDLADYATVARWWNENNHGTNLYIGHAMYRQARATEEPWQAQHPTEIEKQLDLNKRLANVKGSAYFSAKSFRDNPFKINDILLQKYYTHPVLPPSPPSKTALIPEPVTEVKLNKIKRKKYVLRWTVAPENQAKVGVKFMVYQFKKKEKIQFQNPSNLIALTGEHELLLSKKNLKEKGDKFAVIAVSRTNVLGKPSQVSK